MKMLKRFKRLKNNGGFSLVECIVSIGLLSIMSLMVCSMLSATARMRVENSDREKEIGDQIDTIVAGTPAQTQALTDGEAIKFFVGGAGSAIDSIGNTPSDADKKISANKEFDPTANMQIGALDFNFDDYKAKVIEDSGGPGGTPGEIAAVPKVFGGIDLDGDVTLGSSNPAPPSSGEYTIVWNVKYILKSTDVNEAIKIMCPIGAKFDDNPISWTSGKKDEYVLIISDRTVRVYTNTVDTQINFNITFKMSETDFENNYKSFADYFGRSAGTTSTSFSKQSDGSFKMI